MGNEDEPCYWSDINLQDIGLGFEAGEKIPPGENTKGQFNKLEFMNKFVRFILYLWVTASHYRTITR